MCRVLVTAFEPYDRWSENASWLTLVAVTRDLPAAPHVTTRLYPVDYARLRERLQDDLAADYDYALHLGQAPGSTALQLEVVGLNAAAGWTRADSAALLPRLEEEGPDALMTDLPLGVWAERLRGAGVPACVSYHAGTFLCNATLYWTQFFTRQRGGRTRATFVHLPLDHRQVAEADEAMPSLSAEVAAQGVRLLLESLAALPAVRR